MVIREQEDRNVILLMFPPRKESALRPTPENPSPLAQGVLSWIVTEDLGNGSPRVIESNYARKWLG